MVTSAHAQQWLGDRIRGEGRGILVGTLELHPGIGAEIGYDSNVFLSEDPESSAVLRVAPSFYVSTLSGERLQGEEPKVNFRGGVSGTFKHYFATSLSSHPDMGVSEDMNLKWNASSIFALELFQDYRRTIDPFGEPGGAIGSGGDDFDRNQLGGGTRLQLSTPGKLLKGGIGYRIDWDSFEGDAFNANDSLAHTIGADTSWEFLPKTAVFWNGAFRLHDYLDEDAGGLGQRFGSKSISNKLGLNGSLTERVGFTLAGGYDAAFFDNDMDNEAITAQVEARWRVLVASQWSLGYDRTLRPSFQGNAMRADRIKTEFKSMFGGVLALSAKVEFTFVNFGYDSELMTDREDKHLVTSLGGEYRFVDWFAMTAEVGYTENFTDFVLVIPVDGPDVRNAAEYRRFEAWLGVRAFL
jgi:hypothetical protein